MMKKLSLILPAIAMMLSAGIFTACSDDDDKGLVTTPQTYNDSLQALYPNAQNVSWEVKSNYHVAEFKQGFTEYEVWFKQDASWAMTEKDYGKNLFLVMDNAVNAAFAQGEYGTWTLDDIQYYDRPDTEFYILEVEKTGQQPMQLFYEPSGTLIKAVANSGTDIYPTTQIQ